MKTLNCLFSLLAIVVLSYSCMQDAKNKQGKFHVIKVNQSENTSANLSDFVESSEMIKLETNDSCLIGANPQIDITPEFIFVSDYNNLYQFGKNGKFIRKIGRKGRGPHEYSSIISFTCSAIDENIYIGDLRQILCFDFDGNFIEEIEFNYMPDELEIYNNQLWTFYTKYNRLEGMRSENLNIANRYSLKGGVLQDSVLLKSIKLDVQQGVLAFNLQYLSEAGGKIYLYCPILIEEPTIRDTLYMIQENQLIPVLKVDFSDFAESSGEGKNISILNLNRSKKYLFAEYSYKSKQRLFIYDFFSGNQYNLTEGFNDDIFGTGNVMLRPLDLKFNQMYFTKDAYELVDIIEGINENSNPVIFIVDLKK